MYRYLIKLQLNAELTVRIEADSEVEAETAAKAAAVKAATTNPQELRRLTAQVSEAKLITDSDASANDTAVIRKCLFDLDMALYNKVGTHMPMNALRKLELTLADAGLLDPRRTGVHKLMATMKVAKTADPGYRVWACKAAAAEYRELLVTKGTGAEAAAAAGRRRRLKVMIEHQLRAEKIHYKCCKGEVEELLKLVDSL